MMRRLSFLPGALSLVLLLTAAAPTRAAEQLTLTTPVQTTLTDVQPVSLYLSRARQLVIVEVVGNTGALVQATYPTPAINGPNGSPQPTGAALISTLNTANLTSNSLWKRIIQRLQTDGYLPAGNVTGTPD